MSITSIIKEEIIDLSSRSTYCFDIIPQGKGQFRYYDCILTNYGQIYQIPTNAKILIDEQEFEIVDNKIRLSFDNGLIKNTGLNKFKVCIYLNDSLLSYFYFNLFVIGKE